MLHVDGVTIEPTDPRLVGAAVDRPTAPLRSHQHLEIMGWVLASETRITNVRVRHRSRELARAVLDVPRDDLAERYPGVDGAGHAGFQASLTGLELPVEWELDLVAELGDAEVRFARISGRRDRLTSRHRPRLQPVFITTSGRTGSMALTHLLGMHPQLFAYRPFEVEPRLASYWASVLATLGRPYSYLKPISPGVVSTEPTWWAGIERPDVVTLPERELGRFFGSANADALVRFSQRQVDGFYRRAARLYDRRRARFFIEKMLPDTVERRLLLEMYGGARELVLVRDPRDTFCSVFAYDARRGFLSEGREPLENPVDWVPQLRSYVAALTRAWKDGGHLVRYEDLVQRPDETLRDVLEHIGVDASPSTIDSMRAAARDETPLMAQHRTSPTVEASVGRWRDDLDPAIRERIENDLGDLMTELGYETGSVP